MLAMRILHFCGPVQISYAQYLPKLSSFVKQFSIFHFCWLHIVMLASMELRVWAGQAQFDFHMKEQKYECVTCIDFVCLCGYTVLPFLTHVW